MPPHVFITGASAGIGAACARRFVAEGWSVTASARRGERLGELQGELEPRARQLGAFARSVTLDVRDHDAVVAAIDAADEACAIDTLINNAGLARGLDPVPHQKPKDVAQVVETNVLGLFWTAQAVLRRMIARGRGHLINVGSIAGRQTYKGGAVYCATKAAVRALTEGMRLDTLGSGVRISEIAPGLVETEFSLVRYEGDHERARKVYADCTPLCPEDVADLAFFVASRPAHVTIAETVIFPTDQASVHSLNRRPTR